MTSILCLIAFSDSGVLSEDEGFIPSCAISNLISEDSFRAVLPEDDNIENHKQDATIQEDSVTEMPSQLNGPNYSELQTSEPVVTEFSVDNGLTSTLLMQSTDDSPTSNQEINVNYENILMSKPSISQNPVDTDSTSTGTPVETTMQEENRRTITSMRAEFGVLNCNGEIVPVPAPTCETTVDREMVTDLEKRVHFEFFEGRANKTPQRYLKIRNYLLDQW